MNALRLRDGNRAHVAEIYPLNDFPRDVLVRLCGHIVYLLAVGRTDLSGNDFGDGFAWAIGGTHLASPVGIADVVQGKSCWSAKTVKNPVPFKARHIRLISGRNSPDYSCGISDPHHDIQKTGEAVLKIWNERINIAYSTYSRVRTVVLVRSTDLSQFTIYEEDMHQVRISDYEWKVNSTGNFIGIDRNTEQTCFTWQPHGSQFTIHSQIPQSAMKFTLRRPAPLDKEAFLVTLRYGEEWLHFLED